MANPEHVKVVKRGTQATTEWRKEHPTIRLDLTDANLLYADLSFGALFKANLTNANLSRTDLSFSALADADLSRADLSAAKLAFADLTGADLTGADLSRADLSHAFLEGADLTRATLDSTVLVDCDLGTCKGLDTAVHRGPSHIATDTLLASIRGAGNVLTAELTTFFRSAGVPRELLAMLPRIVVEVQYNSCFLSYGEPDRTTAERLYHDLQARGISCWLYAFDATPGRRAKSEFKTRLREADRMVLLCSAHSLIREGVLTELEEVIDDDPEKLVPISLESLWQAPGFRIMRSTRDLGPWLRERNYADFDKLGYDEGLRRLLKALERPTTSVAPPP